MLSPSLVSIALIRNSRVLLRPLLAFRSAFLVFLAILLGLDDKQHAVLAQRHDGRSTAMVAVVSVLGYSDAAMVGGVQFGCADWPAYG